MKEDFESLRIGVGKMSGARFGVGSEGHESVCVACASVLDGPVVARAGKADLVACRTCESWTARPRPTVVELVEIHNSPGYAHKPYFEGRRQREGTPMRRAGLALAHILEAGTGLRLQGARLLDVGCDTGAFVAALAGLTEMQPCGVDVSAWATGQASERGFEAHTGTVETAPSHYTGFTVVTAVDVLEHVADPLLFMTSVRDRLVPGGLLYVQTPNPGSTVYQLGRILSSAPGGPLGGLLDRLFPPEHVQYFTRRGLASLAARSGFDITWITTRRLPADEIATSFAVRAGIMVLQLLDRISRRSILLVAILRRPDRSAPHEG